MLSSGEGRARFGADRFLAGSDALVDPNDEPDGSDPDLVARSEGQRSPHPLAVDEGPVPRSEIANAPPRGDQLNNTMHPRHGSVEGQRNVIRR